MRITLSPKKTADISGRHHWFPSEMMCENLAQEFHTDDVLLHPLSSQFRDTIFILATTKTLNYADWLGMIKSYKVKHMQCDRCIWNKLYSLLECFRKQTLKKCVSYSGPQCFAIWSRTNSKAKREGQLTKRKGPRGGWFLYAQMYYGKEKRLGTGTRQPKIISAV